MTQHLPRQHVELNGLTTAYLDHGEGEPIVALHGIPTSSLLFTPLLPFLRDYRLMAPDLLGQGHTEVPPTGLLDYSAYADHLRAFLEMVPPPRFHLLVHDLGGVLGLDWATEHVERIASLTVLSTTLTGSVRIDALYMANLLFGQSVLRWGMSSTLKRAQQLDPALQEEWITPWSRRRILRGTDHFAHDHLRRIRSQIDRIRVPILIIWGQQDTIFPLRHAATITQAWPHAHLHVIPRCGHWSPVDAPDELAQFMVEFFRANGHA